VTKDKRYGKSILLKYAMFLRAGLKNTPKGTLDF